MASQVLIPYHFTEHSFKETCQKMHFFGTDHHEFILSHQLPKRSNQNLLISVDDLLRKKTETKLSQIIEQLRICHPDEDIKARALAIEELTPNLIHQCQVDYAVFDLHQSQQVEKLVTNLHDQKCPTRLYFNKNIWQQECINLLWLEPINKSKRQFQYVKGTQTLPTSFEELHKKIIQLSPFQTATLRKLPQVIKEHRIELIVVR